MCAACWSMTRVCCASCRPEAGTWWGGVARGGFSRDGEGLEVGLGLFSFDFVVRFEALAEQGCSD